MSALWGNIGSLAAPVRRWSRLGLSQQYALASLPVMIVGMLGLGAWVTRSIEAQVIQNTAVSASLFVNSFVEPTLQGLKQRAHLQDDEIQALNRLVAETPLGQQIRSFKVWGAGGRVVYYSREGLVGQVFGETHEQERAWNGEVAAELSSLGDHEDAMERDLGIPLLEVYMPVRQHPTERVIAVAEFYKDARELEQHLAESRRITWLVVATVTLVMYGALFGIVQAGGRLIRQQAQELRGRVFELSRLLAQNETLRARVSRATQRTTELNEQYLRRLSAELHDGPAQALGLALLRLDTLGGSRDGATQDQSELERIRDTLQDALGEIRQLCRGLSLPELEGLDVQQTVARAVTSHRRRTATEVQFTCEQLGDTKRVSMPIKLTAYRVAQEALMNAFRHAGGKGQAVSLRREGRWLHLMVSDSGRGLRADADESAEPRTTRLGVRGLRERVESLGGRFELESSNAGTRVDVRLPLDTGE
jgi:signal transduction histidine kinase